jgi:hypothetical protein
MGANRKHLAMTITPNKWELDVQGYLNVCNITSATPRKQIRDFSAGVNDLGLWNSMVCWPLRSSQNYGSGTTAFSLGGLGTFNGELIDGPTWNSDGINTSPTNSYVRINQDFLNGTNSIVNLSGSMLGVFANFSTNFGLISNRGASGNFWDFGIRNSTTQIYSIANATGGTNQIVTKADLNTNNLQFSSWRMDGSANRYTTRWNGTNAQSAVISGGAASSRSHFQIGRENTGQYALKCAFLMTLTNVAITDAQHDALEVIYKDTLGQGITLP